MLYDDRVEALGIFIQHSEVKDIFYDVTTWLLGKCYHLLLPWHNTIFRTVQSLTQRKIVCMWQDLLLHAVGGSSAKRERERTKKKNENFKMPKM